MLDLYERIWDGAPLGDDEFVFSVLQRKVIKPVDFADLDA